MNSNQTNIWLCSLDKTEKVRMTDAFPFFTTGDMNNREKLIEIGHKLYNKSRKINFKCDNGNLPDEYRSFTRSKDLHFYTVIQFKQEYLSQAAIMVLGSCDDWEWRYFYGIAYCDEDRELYLVSYSNAYSPNWNKEYYTQRYVKLADVDYPILKSDGVIYRMDDAIHAAINDMLMEGRPMYSQDKHSFTMVVRDQHGNYFPIVGKTMEDVFRDYADNYTGYRNYRRQMVSEWEIVDDGIRQKFEEWKKNATGLKSDFDKFYGGGIVD